MIDDNTLSERFCVKIINAKAPNLNDEDCGWIVISFGLLGSRFYQEIRIPVFRDTSLFPKCNFSNEEVVAFAKLIGKEICMDLIIPLDNDD